MARDKINEDEEEQEEDEYEKQRREDYIGFKRNMDSFKSTMEGMTSDSESMKKQGNAYFSWGCFSQATIMYSDAIELQPHNAVLYCNRSMAYLKQDMPELALADALQSLTIDRSVENIKAYWRKAQALLDMSRYEEAVEASGEGLELHARNPHLNKVRRKAKEAIVLNKLGAGDWVGKMDSGIEQRLGFSKEGEMAMSVFGHTLTSTFELSVEGAPVSMVVRMKQQLGPGSPPPAPPIPYIFEFHDDGNELWLCHPVDGSRDLPQVFEGPGLVKYRRVEHAADEASTEQTGTLEERCVRYMKEMNTIIPLMARQLPEKPSDEQIKEEVKMCSRISVLKKKYGMDVHARAVELARAPMIADSEDMRELATELRKRFLARKFITEDKASVVEEKSKPEDTKATSPSQQVPSQSAMTQKSTPKSVSCFGGLITRFCGGHN
jgi:hypothetical protein